MISDLLFIKFATLGAQPPNEISLRKAIKTAAFGFGVLRAIVTHEKRAYTDVERERMVEMLDQVRNAQLLTERARFTNSKFAGLIHKKLAEPKNILQALLEGEGGAPMPPQRPGGGGIPPNVPEFLRKMFGPSSGSNNSAPVMPDDPGAVAEGGFPGFPGGAGGGGGGGITPDVPEFLRKMFGPSSGSNNSAPVMPDDPGAVAEGGFPGGGEIPGLTDVFDQARRSATNVLQSVPDPGDYSNAGGGEALGDMPLVGDMVDRVRAMAGRSATNVSPSVPGPGDYSNAAVDISNIVGSPHDQQLNLLRQILQTADNMPRTLGENIGGGAQRLHEMLGSPEMLQSALDSVLRADPTLLGSGALAGAGAAGLGGLLLKRLMRGRDKKKQQEGGRGKKASENTLDCMELVTGHDGRMISKSAQALDFLGVPPAYMATLAGGAANGFTLGVLGLLAVDRHAA